MKSVLIFFLFLIACNNTAYQEKKYYPNELSFSGEIEIKEEIQLSIKKNEYGGSPDLRGLILEILPEDQRVENLILFIKDNKKVGGFTVIGKLSIDKKRLLISVIKAANNKGQTHKLKPIGR